MKTTRRQNILTATLLCAGLALPASAQDHVVQDGGTVQQGNRSSKVYPSKPPYSPYAGRNFPTRPLFGDTHLHTSMSFDAGMFGARLTRWRRTASPGEEVTSPPPASG